MCACLARDFLVDLDDTVGDLVALEMECVKGFEGLLGQESNQVRSIWSIGIEEAIIRLLHVREDQVFPFDHDGLVYLLSESHSPSLELRLWFDRSDSNFTRDVLVGNHRYR